MFFQNVFALEMLFEATSGGTVFAASSAVCQPSRLPLSEQLLQVQKGFKYADKVGAMRIASVAKYFLRKDSVKFSF